MAKDAAERLQFPPLQHGAAVKHPSQATAVGFAPPPPAQDRQTPTVTGAAHIPNTLLSITCHRVPVYLKTLWTKPTASSSLYDFASFKINDKSV